MFHVEHMSNNCYNIPKTIYFLLASWIIFVNHYFCCLIRKKYASIFSALLEITGKMDPEAGLKGERLTFLRLSGIDCENVFHFCSQR